MASSSNPYSREDWNDLVGNINAKLDEEGCDEIDRLPLVPPAHRWADVDITEARRVMQESCDSISFSSPLDLWGVDTVQEIEDQIGNMGCDCENELPECGNALGTVLTDLREVAPTACTNDFSGGDHSAARAAVLATNAPHIAAVSSYNSAFTSMCFWRPLLSSSDPEILALATAGYNTAISDINAAKAVMESTAAESFAAAVGAIDSGYESYISLMSSVDPWPDQDECYCSGSETPTRCRPSWVIQTREFNPSFGFSTWFNVATGVYTPTGAIKVNTILDGGTGIARFKCATTGSCTPNPCDDFDTITYFYRLVQSFPAASGPSPC